MASRQVPSFKTVQQEERALAERRANEVARERGLQLPFPNPWDGVDPTKVPPDATEAEIQASYEAFRRLCRPRARKQHRL